MTASRARRRLLYGGQASSFDSRYLDAMVIGEDEVELGSGQLEAPPLFCIDGDYGEYKKPHSPPSPQNLPPGVAGDDSGAAASIMFGEMPE
jgi:hypothetical protein